MNLYEFVNPSDMITFYASDDEIAQVVAIYVGNGKAGLRIQNDDREMPCSMYLFDSIPDSVEDTIRRVLKERFDDFIKSAHSFACCSFSQRPIYDEYTSNGSDIEKRDKWHDRNRTSISDFCKYAWGLKLKGKG